MGKAWFSLTDFLCLVMLSVFHIAVGRLYVTPEVSAIVEIQQAPEWNSQSIINVEMLINDKSKVVS